MPHPVVLSRLLAFRLSARGVFLLFRPFLLFRLFRLLLTSRLLLLVP